MQQGGFNPASPSWSFWEQDVFPTAFDLAVIGGGLVGVSAALSALERRPDLRIAVLERGAYPIGASSRNAGFACLGSMTELLADIDHLGEEATWQLVARRWQGLQRLRHRLGDQALALGWHGGYELFRAGDEGAYARCMDHLDDFNRRLQALTGHRQTLVTADDRLAAFGFAGVQHLILHRAEGQLHPGRMTAALYEQALNSGVHLLRGMEVLAVLGTEGGFELLNRGERPIRARRVLVANNGFARQLLPELDVQPARNQVLLTAPVSGGLPWRGTFHYRQGYLYFRNVGNRILLGGARDLDPRGEQTAEFGTHDRIQGALAHWLNAVIAPGRQLVPEYWWSGILGMGLQKWPLVQEVRPGLFVAVRLSGMGVALGSRLADEVVLRMFPEG